MDAKGPASRRAFLRLGLVALGKMQSDACPWPRAAFRHRCCRHRRLHAAQQGGEDGLTEFDLGIGDGRYKRSWCNRRDEMFDSVIATSAAGRIGRGVVGGMLSLKRYAKETPAIDSAYRTARRLAATR